VVRIAQVSPLYESVPPKLYGGTERVVHFLTEELVRQGHDVTLFASADSVTSASLVPCAPQALRLDHRAVDHLAHHVRMVEEVCRRQLEFDLIHFHIDYIHFPSARRFRVPTVTTLHQRMDTPDLAPLYRTFADLPLVSISDAQRAPLPFSNFVGTVYHGLPPDQLSFHRGPGTYLAFLGRISPEKGLHHAIQIARRLGMPLKIAAKLDRKDRDYYRGEIEPHLDDTLFDFVGEIDERQKDSFLGGAAALLFPIEWPEPFGLVMIESMACGTPVVAFRCGSVPEVMRNGVSGYVVDDLEAAVRATKKAVSLPRARVRAYFEERFQVSQMAAAYLGVYRGLLAEGRAQPLDGERAARTTGPLFTTDGADLDVA
jgi:glycosyltransferase involved in cell wall biosynthesis